MIPINAEYKSFEVMIAKKICNFISLHRPPSQTKAEFENFIKDLELNFLHIIKSISDGRVR